MVAVRQKRCPEGYGVRSLRLMREAKSRGMHLTLDGSVVLPTGKVHTARPQWGRRRINLSIDGENMSIQTARVVCFLAHGEPPTPNSVVDHIDGDTLNDHYDNLRWATYSENTRNTAHSREETWEQKAIRACEGMDDPAAEIARLREGHKRVAMLVIENDKNGLVDWGTGIRIHLSSDARPVVDIVETATLAADLDIAKADLREALDALANAKRELPVAADVTDAGMCAVSYTDAEWEELRAVTKCVDAVLAKHGRNA